MRFPILASAPHFSTKVVSQLCVACCAIHNFIRRTDDHDELILQVLQEFRSGENGSNGQVPETAVPVTAITRAQREIANAQRDGIAEQMWAQFQQRIRDQPAV